MEIKYSAEKHLQILIALLKEHKIKRIVVSPGSANACFVGSVQQDSYFQLYSAVDERSAAYIACGMAAEIDEPIAIVCTGATASRNYLPGLTEAYYRKLPVLAITATRTLGNIGHNIDQVIDRTVVPKDVAKLSVCLPIVHDDNEEKWECEMKVNNALLELKRHGGGPVHINLQTTYSVDFSVQKLPTVRVIERIVYGETLPKIFGKRIGIFVGAHKKWSERLKQVVDLFCEKYNAVVFCDRTSNYNGNYGVFFNILMLQKLYYPHCLDLDLLIHIGDVSASSFTTPKQVWRVNPDGEVRDTFKRLKYVYEMKEEHFFEVYNDLVAENPMDTPFYKEVKEVYIRLIYKLEEKRKQMPFSNIWAAMQMYSNLPDNCVMHFGILNSLRSWNLFQSSQYVEGYSNTGGFGIDGGISSLLGASLMNSDRLVFGIFGDLAFFYDMNAIGNRHVGNNIRLMIINNGMGGEFKNNLGHTQRSGIGEDANSYIAAGGHFGNKSRELVKHYAQDLGFNYISATTKDEFLENITQFLDVQMMDKPVLFEIFTDSKADTDSLELVQTLEATVDKIAINKAKNKAKDFVGVKNVEKIKKILKK